MYYHEGLLTKYRHVTGQKYLKQLVPWLMEQPFLDRATVLALIAWLKEHPEVLHASYIQYNAIGYRQTKEVRVRDRLVQELCVLWAQKTGRSIELQRPLPGGFVTACNVSLGAPWRFLQMDTTQIQVGDERTQVRTIPQKTKEHVAPGVFLLDEDHNPYNTSNAHPDVAFVAYDLGGYTREQWQMQFREAFSMVKQAVPELYQLLLSFVDSIVPMGYTPGKQYSSSYKESPCVLYLSYTDTTRKQAEALVHEIQHTVYNAIDACTPILTNPREERYLSGYRPDPRPIQGCLLGVHAFAAVQWFYTERYQQVDEAEQADLAPIIATIHEQNRVTLDTVRRHGMLTEHGQAIVSDCEALILRTMPVYESLSEEIRRKARAHMDGHIAKVQGALPEVLM